MSPAMSALFSVEPPAVWENNTPMWAAFRNSQANGMDDTRVRWHADTDYDVKVHGASNQDAKARSIVVRELNKRKY